MQWTREEWAEDTCKIQETVQYSRVWKTIQYRGCKQYEKGYADKDIYSMVGYGKPLSTAAGNNMKRLCRQRHNERENHDSKEL